MLFPKTQVRLFVCRGLDVFAQEQQGQILSAAREGRDLVPAIRAEYERRLLRLAGPYLGIARLVAASMSHAEMRELVEEVVCACRDRDDEVGLVAREYPAWLTDHVERLRDIALSVLGVRKDAVPQGTGERLRAIRLVRYSRVDRSASAGGKPP